MTTTALLDRDFDGWVDITMAQPTSRGTTQLRLLSGEIDDAARDYFGHAYCHWLAGAISSLTGWQIATIDYEAQPGEWKPAHSAIVTPTGTVLDIFGEHSSIQPLLEKYSRGNGGCRTRYRIVPNEHMPGDTITGIDDQRGDHLWWAVERGDKAPAIFLHFARLVLRQNGHRQALNQPDSQSARDWRVDAARRLRQLTSQSSAPTTQGGTTGMSSVDEVRAVLAQTNEKANQVLGALQQAALNVEEIQQALGTTAGSSSQHAAQEAIGLYAQAKEAITSLQGVIRAGTSATDTYAAHL